ncbi:MAG TPA: TonB-dependent receptor, partial [Thermoanaerobaculia bacterium]|nr:TonB-dependent receptor [Thermoanaerobaculia bacterium]
MTRARRVSLYLAFGLCVLMLGTPALLAQATTGHLSGVVTVEEDGTRLPGVTVSALHEPTSIRYTSVTGGDGRFLMANVRVGGPYRVTANLEGYGPTEVSNVHVNLGATTELVIQLELAEISESIEVVADADPLLSNRTGSTSAVSTEQIANLPTINRSLQDFARTNPYFNVDSPDASGTRLTVAGRNNRYNTIQIDGAVNNDLFGLADTGTPGGQTDSQPISLDAIEQLQLVVSPYDVRQGGFTGGGINAVTRSGSNEFHGSLF